MSPRRLSCALALVAAVACRRGDTPDAYGNFEADEVVVAAEAAGPLRQFTATEGRVLAAGAAVGQIDTLPLALERDQLAAQRAALATQRTEAARQLDALGAQREIAARTWARQQQLSAAGAATAQQRDQAERDDRVLAAQLGAAQAGLERLAAERTALEARLALVTERLRRATVINPVSGTILAQYARAGEVVASGQPLYRIANLDSLTLRAYVSGDQLAATRLGGAVTVRVDARDGALAERPGTITWVSDRAEFTPTPVQTRDERADLVYAVKIRVANADGALKIGMPADVSFGAVTAQAPARP